MWAVTLSVRYKVKVGKPLRHGMHGLQVCTYILLLTECLFFMKESRRLYQFHYVNWPDHDVPSSFDSILDMISLMRKYQEHEDVPICIHCRYRNIFSVERSMLKFCEIKFYFYISMMLYYILNFPSPVTVCLRVRPCELLESNPVSRLSKCYSETSPYSLM